MKDLLKVVGVEVQVPKYGKKKVEVMEKLSFRIPHSTVRKGAYGKDKSKKTKCGKELSGRPVQKAKRLVRKVERRKEKR